MRAGAARDTFYMEDATMSADTGTVGLGGAWALDATPLVDIGRMTPACAVKARSKDAWTLDAASWRLYVASTFCVCLVD